MGERKVQNRYVPPDFDPSILPKSKRDYSKLIEVRMMLPFSIQCLTCGEYMYRGKKFNSKKESINDDFYLGVRKFRFYIKCCVCSAELTFKTDPKNADYEMEGGGTRNFELWRDTQEAVDTAAKEREEEDNQDVMKSLENRTLDSKLEMDILDALDEMKAINQRHERVDTNALITHLKGRDDKVVLNANGITDAEEDLVKSINFRRHEEGMKKRSLSSDSSSDEDKDKDPIVLPSLSSSSSSSQHSIIHALHKGITKESSSINASISKAPLVIVKRKKIVHEDNAAAIARGVNVPDIKGTEVATVNIFAAYGSGTESD